MAAIRFSVKQWSEYLLAVREDAGVRAAERRRRASAAARERADRLALANQALVERIAVYLFRRFTRSGQNGFISHLQLEDFVGAGQIGLMRATERFNPDLPDEDFPRFAWFLIRGSILDANRRSAYRDRQMQSIDAIEEETGSRPGWEARDPRPLPDEIAAENERKQRLHLAIDRLPRDERRVIKGLLAGKASEETAAKYRRSIHWARKRLLTAKELLIEELAAKKAA